MKPSRRPANPNFSSGPCAKRPGWSVDVLRGAPVGRSHRSDVGRAQLRAVLDASRALLGLPDDYLIGIVPASDTGAFEMAMWTMLGARGVDVLAWESFGTGWVGDMQSHLKLSDLRLFEADYGSLPDLAQVDCDRDVVFTWNGTTSGVCVPNGDWIAADREGLTFCDATSAAFAMDLPWDKLDVITYSWQKVLGGEAQHGILILSPRAVARLENYVPPWPLPKIFRLTKKGKINAAIFRGDTINTPSLLCAEDALDALRWAESEGGRSGLIARANANLGVLSDWVERTPWVVFLAGDPASRSTTSVCFKITDPWFAGLDEDAQRAMVKQITGLLSHEGIAYDIDAYRDAPPGLRIWAGATIERSDLEALCPWLDWAFAEVKAGALETASA